MEDSLVPELVKSGREHLDQLEEQLRVATQAHAEALQELSVTQARLHELSVEAASIRGYLKALGEEVGVPESSEVKTEGKRRSSGPRRERVRITTEAVYDTIKNSDKPLTAHAIAEMLDGPRTSVMRAASTLVKEGKIEITGTEEKLEGQRGQARRLYSAVKEEEEVSE